MRCMWLGTVGSGAGCAMSLMPSGPGSFISLATQRCHCCGRCCCARCCTKRTLKEMHYELSKPVCPQCCAGAPTVVSLYEYLLVRGWAEKRSCRPPGEGVWTGWETRMFELFPRWILYFTSDAVREAAAAPMLLAWRRVK